jgi:hypothetical protein
MRLLNCVTDEVMTMDPYKYKVRVHVWRGRDLTPVVLLIQMPNQAPVVRYIVPLAQQVLQRFLGFSLPAPIVFCYGKRGPSSLATKTIFQTTGYELRPILVKAETCPVDPNTIAKIFHLEGISC